MVSVRVLLTCRSIVVELNMAAFSMTMVFAIFGHNRTWIRVLKKILSFDDELNNKALEFLISIFEFKVFQAEP